MALSWGPADGPDTDVPARRRVGYRTAGAVALAAGATVEVVVRLAVRQWSPVWYAVRLPLLALCAVVLAQVPVERRRGGPRTTRPRRSELRRYLERR